MTPEHKARWLASVRKTNNRPASGMLAMGGWGFVDPSVPGRDPTRKPVKVSPERRKVLEARADQYFEKLDVIASNEEHPQQINAILAVQRRVWGKETETIAGDQERPVEIRTTIAWDTSNTDA